MSAKDFKVSPIYNRLMNALDADGIRLVRDLVASNEKHIAELPNVGTHCMKLLVELMAKHNLKFA
jgi:DNA-directed RNA polymerase alpha subunit